MGDIFRRCFTISGNFFNISSTSVSVLYLENENRIDPCALSNGTDIAFITCDGSSEPDAHAEPDDADIAYSLSMSSIASPSMPANEILLVLGRRLDSPPLMDVFGMELIISFSNRSLIALTRVFSSIILF